MILTFLLRSISNMPEEPFSIGLKILIGLLIAVGIFCILTIISVIFFRSKSIEEQMQEDIDQLNYISEFEKRKNKKKKY